MHSKYMLIDNKMVLFGSANYSNSTFDGNHEIIFASYNKELVDKFYVNFKQILDLSISKK